jgi:Protein of unknown function (DUF5132)
LPSNVGIGTILYLSFISFVKRDVQMTDELGSDRAAMLESIEGMQAFLLAPIVLPIAVGVDNPFVQTLLREGIILHERVKEAIAHIEEVLDDLASEANTKLIERSQIERSQTASQSSSREANEQVKTSQAAESLMNTVSEINTHVRQATNGIVDLQLLFPLGLGAIALKQLLQKGFELEEIPWYVLAWYAFDSFVKLNETSAEKSG